MQDEDPYEQQSQREKMLYYVIININKKRGDIFRSNTLSEVQHE